jgi:hypothetical protein
LVAANREERFDRPTQYPKIQSGSPRVVCGLDRHAGGTWLGVNQYGLFCAVTNRRKLRAPLDPRSRGLLCRELLDYRSARDAAAHAAKELATGAYAGANYICADARYAAVVHGAAKVEVVELPPGLHVISNGDVNAKGDERDDFVRRMLELHTLDSAVTFLAVASRVFSRKPEGESRRGVVLTGNDFGTVSSTLLSLPRKIQQAVYQYAPGPPCDCAYDDLSALLRQVLSTERSRKCREANGNSAAGGSGNGTVNAAEKGAGHGGKESEKSRAKAKVGAAEPVKKKK